MRQISCSVALQIASDTAELHSNHATIGHSQIPYPPAHRSLRGAGVSHQTAHTATEPISEPLRIKRRTANTYS